MGRHQASAALPHQGDKLTIASTPQPAVNFGNRMMHGELVWYRVK